jgi:tripartite-type tricarboxylate transporter receptor subunit TctC
MRRVLRSLIALAVLISPSIAHAQDRPNRTVRIVVPFPRGGSGDVSVRLVADRLAPLLGQSVVVDNRTGAAGNIGNEFAARSAPDGYTLVLLSACYPRIRTRRPTQVCEVEPITVIRKEAGAAIVPRRTMWTGAHRDPRLQSSFGLVRAC